MRFEDYRADQRAEHDVLVDDRRIDGALADGGRDLELKHGERHDVEERGKPHRGKRLQHASRNDSGDRVRGVVKAVHEVEGEREHDEHDRHAESDLDGIHGQSSRYAFSRTMPSMMFATSSQRSVTDSSSS
jgi:hypothetical protein